MQVQPRYFISWPLTPCRWDLFIHFFIPTFLGNILGSVPLVAALGHAQILAGSESSSGFFFNLTDVSLPVRLNVSLP